ncbi:uncharacterized protein CANTADRAFT_251223 [Suhomyces tanzawaensis NRRL Y-17324]|uniref:Uncharacterized protein n=1 Tax=Suhomyces tanzawaensis NRRL Y-17324 TaxID=984487 RepID=A0A1E4SIC3_9ASCO|nr:uncharacterized protein CANTADRAFT_251223 [Suhomyces tanzawaensis NRRL Y-17324]ODV79264.1 hypothetical protein CANTADRAFT_251223 [Suhomyces tanzawaensis NRRL Y-17324]
MPAALGPCLVLVPMAVGALHPVQYGVKYACLLFDAAIFLQSYNFIWNLAARLWKYEMTQSGKPGAQAVFRPVWLCAWDVVFTGPASASVSWVPLSALVDRCRPRQPNLRSRSQFSPWVRRPLCHRRQALAPCPRGYPAAKFSPLHMN